MKAIHNKADQLASSQILVTYHVKLQNESNSQLIEAAENVTFTCDLSRKITK